MGYFDAKGDKVNTFQLAVASDGESSYAIFLYPEAGIEWIRGEGKNGNMGDARAQAGIISGEGINFIFAESGSDQASGDPADYHSVGCSSHQELGKITDLLAKRWRSFH